ncbi:hypothetical protein AZE42_06406, partial [Rhizopogon vesiculosus]
MKLRFGSDYKVLPLSAAPICSNLKRLRP